MGAIAFYNFENLFDTEDDPKNWGDDEFLPSGPYRYTNEIYQQKLHNLAFVIKQLGTDVTLDGPAIIGTAEIENDKVLEDLTQQPEIKERGYKFIHFDSPDSRGIDVAMLYNPKYFKVLFARTLNTDISQFGEKAAEQGMYFMLMECFSEIQLMFLSTTGHHVVVARQQPPHLEQ